MPSAMNMHRMWQAGRQALMQADLLTAGFGRTRMFIRYARSIAPWLHPPRWLFSIGANYFVDQVCPDAQAWSLVSE